jgi:hypothetical protein
MLRFAWYYVRLDRPVRVIIRAEPPQNEFGNPAGT